MLRQETLTLITTLTPSLPALRQIMLAEQVFCVSTTVQLLVRTWFRQLTPMGRGVQQVLSLLPNSRLDGREFLVFKGKAYGFRYYINGQRHGVSKRWKVGVCGHASGLRSDLGCVVVALWLQARTRVLMWRRIGVKMRAIAFS